MFPEVPDVVLHGEFTLQHNYRWYFWKHIPTLYTIPNWAR
jgi:hypothetical protein